MILALENDVKVWDIAASSVQFQNDIKFNVCLALATVIRFLFVNLAVLRWISTKNQLAAIFLINKVAMEGVFQLVALTCRIHHLPRR